MIDLWYTLTKHVVEEQLLDAYREMLAPEEQARCERLHHIAVRTEFLTARALARTALSAATGDDPKAWRFSFNAYGKPAVADPPRHGLEFNLSHTHGLVVCAVHRGASIGIDAEDRDRRTAGVDLARRYFAPSETASLEAAPQADQHDLFFRYWTLKEAFVKARGRGLSLPLDQFAFTLTVDMPPQIDFAAGQETATGQWQFAEVRLGGQYQIAICVRKPVTEPMLIRIREALPLNWEDSPGELKPNACRAWAIP